MVRWPWLVIGFWIVIAAGLPMVFPSLMELSQRSPAAMLPPEAPSAVATEQMTEAFHESGSENMLLVVLSNENGLGPADEEVYRALVDKLKQDTKNVVMLQDFITTPPLREVMQSEDKKAWLMPVGLVGLLASPESYAATSAVIDTVNQTVDGSSLTAHVTGPAATLADIADIGEKDRIAIEIATVGMLFTILLIIYRNLLTMLLPLMTIGVSLLAGQGVVAGFGSMGLSVSAQTITFMTAMVAGAGTDYAVFMISRYHDFIRLGEGADDAICSALNSIGKVIAASAATVAVTFLAMVFTELTVFSSVGIALAIAIAVGFSASVTFLPAMLVLTGRRGWCKPRRDITGRMWRRSGIRIVRRPKSHLAVSLIILIILASCASLVRYNYDDRKGLPQGVESTQGYDAIGRHFPVNSSLPQYLLIKSPNDLRTPEALADMEMMAQRISQLPDLEAVRGITRPTGESLEQARLSFQAGEVGSQLDQATNVISERQGELDLLVNGSDQVADALGDVRGEVVRAVATVSGLVDALTDMQNQFGGTKTLKEFDSATRLVNAMRGLGDSIGITVDDATASLESVEPVVNALNASPICDIDPRCVNTRAQLRKLIIARDNGTLDKIKDLSTELRTTDPMKTLESTATGLRRAANTAVTALKSVGLQDPKGVQSKLTQLKQSAGTLADASRQVADGVQLLVDETKKMGVGLGEASAFLLAMKNDATTPAMSGFYIPPQFLAGEDFKKAAQLFISPDGHTARYLIQTKLSPFSTQAMDQINAVIDAARSAQPNTLLADAEISMSGYSVTLRDTRDYYNSDIRFIILATVLVVMVILMILLRAIVAPLYLIASVVVSYLSALGIGVVVFQLLQGQELHWSTPGLTFIILVAVGADYNLLLISRIRDESAHGLRTAVIRTVGATGGVITAAGCIFAASMFGMLFASISTLVQVGFVVGIGILLDTFLVRTITVPAIAVLVGKANWWPSRWQPEVPAKPQREDDATTAAPV